MFYCFIGISKGFRHIPTGFKKYGTIRILDISLFMNSEEITALPRLSENVQSLVSWTMDNGGTVDAAINRTAEGWTLINRRSVSSGESIITIPKHICIFSKKIDSPFLSKQTNQLISSISENQWRVRLAVALLSERVRPNSFYRPYLRNLPFEFWGLPMFFNSSEFKFIQDFSLISKQNERCRFILEFTNQVLLPLHRTSLDPFFKNKPDVNDDYTDDNNVEIIISFSVYSD